MRPVKILLISVIVLSATAFAAFQTVNWKAQEDYSIKWNGNSFSGLKATIMFDEKHPEKSKLAATIDARTVNTGNKLKDDHTRNALETDKYPIISFISTSVKQISDSRFEAMGNLTIKGVTKEVKLPFAFNSQKNLIDKFPFVTAQTFSGVLTVITKEFNITRMGTPDQVVVEISVPVTK